MCDYSLHHVASRPAQVGDKLVSTKFPNSITRGFSAVGEPNVAVCLLPGTELAFEHNVECDPTFGFLPNRKVGQSVARFRLCAGQRATVLQLPAAARATTATEERQRDTVAPDPTPAT